MPLNDQIANLVNNVSQLLNSVNVSKQKVDNAAQFTEVAIINHEQSLDPHTQYIDNSELIQSIQNHTSQSNPHEQYVQKVNGLDPVMTNSRGWFVKPNGEIVNGRGTPLSDAAIDNFSTNPGLLSGRVLQTSQVWQTIGDGSLTAEKPTVHSSGYLYHPTQTNSYCFVNSGQTVYAVEVMFSGPLCTLAIAPSLALANMIHVNFTASTGLIDPTVFIDGVLTQPESIHRLGTIPNINDGQQHKLRIELSGNYLLCYVNDVLYTTSYDTRYAARQGNWSFVQLHSGVDDRVYSFLTQTGSLVSQDSKNSFDTFLAFVRGVWGRFSSLHVGDIKSTNFKPRGGIYFHHPNTDNGVFEVGSDGITCIRSRGTATGFLARMEAQSFAGNRARIQASNDGVLTISSVTSGGTVTEIIRYDIANTTVTISNARVALTNLPTSEATAQSNCLWVDTSAGNVIKRKT